MCICHSYIMQLSPEEHFVHRPLTDFLAGDVHMQPQYRLQLQRLPSYIHYTYTMYAMTRRFGHFHYRFTSTKSACMLLYNYTAYIHNSMLLVVKMHCSWLYGYSSCSYLNKEIPYLVIKAWFYGWLVAHDQW